MKSPILVILSIFVSSWIPARADDLPKRVEFTRYAAMLAHSPFAVATAPVQAPTTPNWSKDMYIANAAHTTEADYVTVISGSDKNLHEYLSTLEPNGHGYTIANIQWSEEQGETKVTISKDGQYATLGFNQALLSTSSPMVPPPAGMTGPNSSTPRPFPTAPTPVPHVRGEIQRNPRLAPAPMAPPAPNPDK